MGRAFDGRGVCQRKGSTAGRRSNRIYNAHTVDRIECAHTTNLNRKCARDQTERNVLTFAHVRRDRQCAYDQQVRQSARYLQDTVRIRSNRIDNGHRDAEGIQGWGGGTPFFVLVCVVPVSETHRKRNGHGCPLDPFFAQQSILNIPVYVKKSRWTKTRSASYDGDATGQEP